MSDVDALRSEVESLRASNAEYEAKFAAMEKKMEHHTDRAEQKIRAANAKVERNIKKHEKETEELVEKRAEVTRLFKEVREFRESSDKYKFEWDRSKEEVAELNNQAMRQKTEQRIAEMTSEDAIFKQTAAEKTLEKLKSEVAALKGAGDEVLVLMAEIRGLKKDLEESKQAHKSDLEIARAALRAEAEKPPPVCSACGFQVRFPCLARSLVDPGRVRRPRRRTLCQRGTIRPTTRPPRPRVHRPSSGRAAHARSRPRRVRD